MRPKRASSSNISRNGLPRAACLALSRATISGSFFKLFLLRGITLRVAWARSHFAPAMPFEHSVYRRLRNPMFHGFLIGGLDFTHFEDPAQLGFGQKVTQQHTLLLKGQVFATAAAAAYTYKSCSTFSQVACLNTSDRHRMPSYRMCHFVG